MPEFIVEVRTSGRAFYVVEAETAEQAWEHWDEGWKIDGEIDSSEPWDVRPVTEGEIAAYEARKDDK